MDKTVLFRFMTPELLSGKGHFEEVNAKEFHEEKQCEEVGEDASNIGQHIKKLKISAVDIFGDGGPFDPEISGGGRGEVDLSPFFEGFITETALRDHVRVWKQTLVSGDKVLFDFGHILIPGPIAEIHVIALEMILKGISGVGVEEGIQLIDSNAAAVVDSAGLSAVELKQKSLPGIAELEGSSYFKGPVEGQAHDVADSNGQNFLFEAGDD